jgi:hypothetical protein
VRPRCCCNRITAGLFGNHHIQFAQGRKSCECEARIVGSTPAFPVGRPAPVRAKLRLRRRPRKQALCEGRRLKLVLLHRRRLLDAARGKTHCGRVARHRPRSAIYQHDSHRVASQGMAVRPLEDCHSTRGSDRPRIDVGRRPRPLSDIQREFLQSCAGLQQRSRRPPTVSQPTMDNTRNQQQRQCRGQRARAKHFCAFRCAGGGIRRLQGRFWSVCTTRSSLFEPSTPASVRPAEAVRSHSRSHSHNRKTATR